MHTGMAALEWFANRQWIWANGNVVQLERELNVTDRALFNCRVDGVNHKEYFNHYYYTVRKHLLKYSDDTLDASRCGHNTNVNRIYRVTHKVGNKVRLTKS